MQELVSASRRKLPPARAAHILAVDDDPAVLSVLVALLEGCGHQAEIAMGAEEALLRLRELSRCDLVLVDIQMPEADGLWLLDSIRRDHPELPVVMLTGVHDVRVAAHAFRRGAVDYLLKPFDPAQLDWVVGRALEQSRQQRESAAYRETLEEVLFARTSRLRNAMEELELSYDFILEVMGSALDLRDAETEGHCRRVTAYTVALAREMGLDQDQLRTVARGAFLHDIGKIATPDRILLKPGKLDAEEMQIMRRHCEQGYRLTRKIPFLRGAAEIVYTHQESFDGTGYPRGLRGSQIPLGSRIFAVADTLDAVTSDRPYRKARSFREASEEIERHRGTQFDPAIVDTFLGMPLRMWQELREQVDTGRANLVGIPIY
jgi:putative nucleotidyltransferase with HDIG domain